MSLKRRPNCFELIGERRWHVHRPTVRERAALRPGELVADAGVPEEVLLFVLDQVARDDQLSGNALVGIVVGERIHVGDVDSAAIERVELDLRARGPRRVCEA